MMSETINKKVTGKTQTAMNQITKKAYIAPDVTESPVGRLEGVFASVDDCPDDNYGFDPSAGVMTNKCKTGFGGIF